MSEQIGKVSGASNEVYIQGNIPVNEKVMNGIKESDIQWSSSKQSDTIQAGHGNTGICEVKVDGQTHYLFLKPLDPKEALNYEVIQSLDEGKLDEEKVSSYMPRFYGVKEIGNEKYMILQNYSIDEDGGRVEQLADLKLSGNPKGKKIPFTTLWPTRCNQTKVGQKKERRKKGQNRQEISSISARLS